MFNKIDIDTITVSWTPPLAPPSNGYRITVDSEDFSAGIDTMSSSQEISVSLGVRSIHFPGGIATRDITHSVLDGKLAFTRARDVRFTLE